ncbi:hypothetical protein ACHWQZ_G013618 [Mnemiopsis leidyi]
MTGSSDEKTPLKTVPECTESPFPETPSNRRTLTIGEAMEELGCGLGSILYSLAPYCFLLIEGAEVTVMAVVSLILQCEWGLTKFWTSALQVISMATCTISGLLFSHLGDQFGRYPIMLWTLLIILVAGLLSGLSVNLWQIMVCRALVGVGEGLGAGPAATFSAEIPTIKYRSLSMTSVGIGWGLGTALSSGLAYLTLEPYGWKGYLIVLALMCSPVLILLFFIRESPRYDVRVGKVAKARETLRRLARLNFRESELEDFELVQDPNIEKVEVATLYESYQVLSRTGYLSDFWKLVAITLTGQFVYMGQIYAAPLYLNDGACYVGKVNEEKKSCSFDQSVLFDLGVVGLADPISVLLGLLFIDRIGRRNLFLSTCVLPIFVLIPFYFCTSSTSRVIALMAFRGLLSVFGWTNFVIAAEYFPTSVRSFTSSVVNSCYSLASIFSAFVVQFAYDISPDLLTATLQISLVVTLVFVVNIKREMTGQQLEQ